MIIWIFLLLYFSDYFKRGYGKMMDKLGNKREKIVDIQKAVQVRRTEWRGIVNT